MEYEKFELVVFLDGLDDKYVVNDYGYVINSFFNEYFNS